MTKRATHIVVSLSMLLLASCGSKTKVVTPPPSIMAEALAEQVRANELEWQWFTAKLDIKADDGMVPNLGGQLRMRRDSVIWVSVSALLGMEAVRVMARPDSVFVVNKIGNTYMAGSFDDLAERLGTKVRFGELQDMLVGNCLWVVGDDFVTAATEGADYGLACRENANSIRVGTDGFRTTRACLSAAGSSLRLDYGAFRLLDAGRVPTRIGVGLNGMCNFAGQMEYASVSVDKATTFPFKVSAKMKRSAL